MTMPAAGELSGLQERALRVNAKIRQELGPQLLDALRDDDVSNIFRNADGSLWVDRLSAGMERLDITMSHFVAMNLIGTVSGWLGMEVSARSPFLSGELPLDGSRFSATIMPIVASPIIAIRRRAARSRNLDDYVRDGSLKPHEARALRERIKAKDNILIAGAQGSGKTTFGNALLREMFETSDPTRERFAILEDTIELQVPNCVNHYAMRTNASQNIGMDELLRNSLRYTGTRFIVGELRGAEAQVWLEALSTGHPGGLATIHAGDARGALRRFEQLLRKAKAPVDREEIASAINLVLVTRRTPLGGILVADITRVSSSSNDTYALEPLSLFPRLAA